MARKHKQGKAGRNAKRARGLGAVGLAVAASAAVAAPAQAAPGIGTHGPFTERAGFFPEWYEDGAGTRLQLCIDGPECFASIERPNPAAPVTFPGNFPVEAFWWAAETTIPTDGGSVLLVLAQEAVFAGPLEEVIDGDQGGFGRLRVRGDGLEPGKRYRLTYPYGQLEFTATDDVRQVNTTEDVGCIAVPCAASAFDLLGNSSIGPNFLTADNAPAGFVGDGVGASTVTGSEFVPPADSFVPAPGAGEFANYARIDEIDENGAWVKLVGQTDTFTVQGKLAEENGNETGTLFASSGAFGNQPVGQPATTRNVTLRNGGIGDLNVATVSLSGGSDFAMGQETCTGDTLKPAGEDRQPTTDDKTCSVPMTFTPAAQGSRSGTITVTEEGGATSTIALSGNGTVPGIDTDKPSLSFGNRQVNTSAPTQTVVVRNTGQATLHVDGASVSGANSSDFQATGCANRDLLPGAGCQVDVLFTPGGTGVRSASLDVASSAGVKKVQLSGVGVASNVVFVPGGGGGTQVDLSGTAGAAGAGSALAPLSLGRLTISSKIRRPKVRRNGLRVVAQLKQGTQTLRVRVYRKKRNGSKSLLAQGFRAPSASGTYRTVLKDPKMRRDLTKGSYELEVTPGRSRSDLGKAAKYAFKVVR